MVMHINQSHTFGVSEETRGILEPWMRDEEPEVRALAGARLETLCTMPRTNEE